LNKSSFLFTLGRPFSPLYSLLMVMRATLYEKNIFKRHSLSVPVISIGNLTMGGAGKTPVVIYLAQLLRDKGYRPAVISRGYAGTAKGKYNIVTTGTEPLLTPEEAGDEPFMLAETLTGIPVITGKSRIHPCQCAINTFDVNIILLDDGFQHLAIKRDIDLVLFNATTLAGNSRVFPAGVLREPVTALTRCHAFMLTGIDENNKKNVENFCVLLKNRFPDKPLFSAKFSQYKITSASGQETDVNISDMGRAYGFCAIANPIRFQKSIRTTGIDLVEFISFQDHKKYTQRSIDNLCHKAQASGANCLLTTEKDFVKINQYKTNLPLYVLRMKLESDKKFEEYILETLHEKS